MVDEAPQPVVVGANAGIVDAIQAGARYLVVIVTFVTAVLGLVKVRDIGALIAYIQANGGGAFAAVSGLIGLGTAAYGVFKSHKRGAQTATLAADPEVPESSAHLK